MLFPSVQDLWIDSRVVASDRSVLYVSINLCTLECLHRWPVSNSEKRDYRTDSDKKTPTEDGWAGGARWMAFDPRSHRTHGCSTSVSIMLPPVLRAVKHLRALRTVSACFSRHTPIVHHCFSGYKRWQNQLSLEKRHSPVCSPSSDKITRLRWFKAAL